MVRGRSSRADNSSRRGSKRTRKRRQTPQPTVASYAPVNYTPSESLYFGNVGAWDPSRLVGGIKKICFGDEFNIRDTHLDAIVAAGAAFCETLQEFRSGDSDTGNGAWLTDTAAVNLAAACPNLMHVAFEASKGLTDASFIALCRNCPNIRYIAITGNDKVHGSLQCSALEELREQSELGKNLQTISVTDQRSTKEFSNAIEGLSTARKALSIQVGSTDERWGFGVNTWIGGKQIHGFQTFGGSEFHQNALPTGPWLAGFEGW